jgi:hypothetical protein
LWQNSFDFTDQKKAEITFSGNLRFKRSITQQNKKELLGAFTLRGYFRQELGECQFVFSYIIFLYYFLKQKNNKTPGLTAGEFKEGL